MHNFMYDTTYASISDYKLKTKLSLSGGINLNT